MPRSPPSRSAAAIATDLLDGARRPPPRHRHRGRQGVRPRGRLPLRHERPGGGGGPRRLPVDPAGARHRGVRPVRHRLVLDRSAPHACDRAASAATTESSTSPRSAATSSCALGCASRASAHRRRLAAGRQHRAVDGRAARPVRRDVVNSSRVARRRKSSPIAAFNSTKKLCWTNPKVIIAPGRSGKSMTHSTIATECIGPGVAAPKKITGR